MGNPYDEIIGDKQKVSMSLYIEHRKVIRGTRLKHEADFVDFAITSPSDQPLAC